MKRLRVGELESERVRELESWGVGGNKKGTRFSSCPFYGFDLI